MKKIISFIKSIVNGFTGSLDHSQQGFSQKKIISYSFLLLVVSLHFALWRYQLRLGNFSNLAYVLGSDLTAMCACLGINFMHETNIAKNKNGNIVTDDDSSTPPPTQLNS